MKIVVIKCGGSVLDELSPAFFSSLEQLKQQGYKLLFVHGGGPDINQMLALYNVKPEFSNGLRKTTSETLKVVELVLSGQTNRKLVGMLDAYGFRAIGLNGSDGKCLQGDFVNKEELGFVGEIIKVNAEMIRMYLEHDFIPVITPIAATKEGIKLNVNADYAAAAVAIALNAEQCLFVTDVEGVMLDGALVPELSVEQARTGISTGKISGGMIPKVESAISAVNQGLKSGMIVSGKKAFYTEEKWNGTKIFGKERVKQ